MYLALVILIAIIAVLLVLVVLVQNSKGGGLSSEFGGAGSAQMFGVKKTTDLLEQVTWGMAGAIMIFSLVSYVMVSGDQQSSSVIKSANIEKAQSTATPSVAPSLAAPETPAATDSTN